MIATDGLRQRRRAAARPRPSERWSPRWAAPSTPWSARTSRPRVVDFATRRQRHMIVVGVSGTGGCAGCSPVRRATGSRRWPATIDVHLVTHDQVARRASPGRCSPRSPPRGRWPAGSVAVALPTLLTWACTGSPTPTSCRWPCSLFLLASTVAVALIGGLLPGAGRRGRRLPGAQLLLHPPVGTLTVSEPAQRARARGVRRGRGGGGDRGRPRLAPGRRRVAGPHRGGHDERAVALGARPVSDTADAVRGAAPRDLRAGRGRRSWLAARPDGWSWRRPASPCATTPDDGDTRVRGRRRRTCWRCAAAAAGRATSGCSRRSPCRPGWCWSTGGSASGTSGRPTSSGRRPPRTALLARSPTTCARRWPRCGPRSTGCGRRACSPRRTARELVRSVDASADQLERLIDNLLDLSRLQSGLVHPVLRAREPRRGAPAGRGRASRPASYGSSSTSRAAGHHRCRAAGAGGRQPGRQRGPARPAARRCGCSRTCCRTAVEVLVVDRGPGVPPEDRERDVRARSSGSATPRRRARPRAGGRARAHRGARRHARPPRTPRAAG